MFNPALRYLLAENENNGGIIPIIIDDYIYIYCLYLLITSIIFWIVYEMCIYVSITSKIVWIIFQNSLAYVNKFFDLTKIIITITSSIMIFVALKSLGNIFKKRRFTKYN